MDNTINNNNNIKIISWTLPNDDFLKKNDNDLSDEQILAIMKPSIKGTLNDTEHDLLCVHNVFDASILNVYADSRNRKILYNKVTKLAIVYDPKKLTYNNDGMGVSSTSIQVMLIDNATKKRWAIVLIKHENSAKISEEQVREIDRLRTLQPNFVIISASSTFNIKPQSVEPLSKAGFSFVLNEYRLLPHTEIQKLSNGGKLFLPSHYTAFFSNELFPIATLEMKLIGIDKINPQQNSHGTSKNNNKHTELFLQLEMPSNHLPLFASIGTPPQALNLLAVLLAAMESSGHKHRWYDESGKLQENYLKTSQELRKKLTELKFFRGKSILDFNSTENIAEETFQKLPEKYPLIANITDNTAISNFNTLLEEEQIVEYLKTLEKSQLPKTS